MDPGAYNDCDSRFFKLGDGSPPWQCSLPNPVVDGVLGLFKTHGRPEKINEYLDKTDFKFCPKQ